MSTCESWSGSVCVITEVERSDGPAVTQRSLTEENPLSRAWTLTGYVAEHAGPQLKRRSEGCTSEQQSPLPSSSSLPLSLHTLSLFTFFLDTNHWTFHCEFWTKIYHLCTKCLKYTRSFLCRKLMLRELPTVHEKQKMQNHKNDIPVTYNTQLILFKKT